MQGKWFSYIRTLLQDADASLATVTDDSVIAQMLAKDGDVSDYDDTTDSLEALSDTIALLIEHASHTPFIFPESTANLCTLTAHASANTWTDWAEIADNQGTPVTLSSKFAAYPGHLTAMLVEEENQASTLYMVEAAYGASKTVVCRCRLQSEISLVSPTQIPRGRGSLIPAGETLYYRAMCETAGSKTLQVSFRYFLHS